MFVGGGGREGLDIFCVCVELEDLASEIFSERVQLEGHSPKWQALQNFSFQPCLLRISADNHKDREETV